MNESPEIDRMELWNKVCVTDAQYTKKVNQRGGFTAIAAQYQVMEATKLWGPYGGSWGLRNLKFEYLRDGKNDVLELTLEAEFFYPGGVFENSSDIQWRENGDSRKKVMTDVTTKALSKLGFNADVFLGKFDDNKYVEDAHITNGQQPQGRPANQSNPEPQRSNSAPLGVSHGGTPACPKCGGGMRKRNSKNGEFYGCLSYPRCNGTVNVGASEQPTSGPNRNAWIDAKLSALGIDREEFKRFLQKMKRLVAPPGERLSFDHVSDEVMDELRDPATWDKAIAKFNTTMDIAEDDIPF